MSVIQPRARSFVFLGLATVALAACTGGQTNNVPVTSVNPVVQSSNLQFAVGTANLGNGTTGMNLVVTNRSGSGTSAVLLSTPFLSGPFAFTATTPVGVGGAATDGSTWKSGPAAIEAVGPIAGSGCASYPCLAGVPQQSPGTKLSGYPYVSTFGTSGGVFGLGIEKSNSGNWTLPNNGSTSHTGTNVTEVDYAPYPVPLYNATPLFIPWGGPPAYDPNSDGKGTRDGISGDYTQGVLGSQLGLDVFQGVTPSVGTYDLNVQIPTSGGVLKVPQVAYPLAGLVNLPNVSAPTVSVDPAGNISASATLPSAQFVGGYIEIIAGSDAADTGTCNASGTLNDYGANTTVNPGVNPSVTTYYTQWFSGQSGQVVVTAKNGPGPPGSSFPAVCSGDHVTAYVVGFDYNHYAITYNGQNGSSYPLKPALPANTGANLSISPPTTIAAP